MNKKEICAALTAAGVTFDSKLTVEELKALAAANGISTERVAPSLVTLRVTGQRIAEDHGAYSKGETFETTAERAAALGTLVEIVTAAE